MVSCISPCWASSSLLFLGSSAAHLQLFAGLISSAGPTGFYPAFIFAWVSPFSSPTTSMKGVPLPCHLLNCPHDYSCFDTLPEVQSENVVEMPRCLRRRGECECQDNWRCTWVLSLGLLLLVNFTKDRKQAQVKLMHSNWCLQQRPFRAQLLPLMAHESPQISIWARGGATNGSYSMWEGLSLFPSFTLEMAFCCYSI